MNPSDRYCPLGLPGCKCSPVPRDVTLSPEPAPKRTTFPAEVKKGDKVRATALTGDAVVEFTVTGRGSEQSKGDGLVDTLYAGEVAFRATHYRVEVTEPYVAPYKLPTEVGVYVNADAPAFVYVLTPSGRWTRLDADARVADFDAEKYLRDVRVPLKRLVEEVTA